ncbi:MAG: hypothetical protein AAF602_17015 [Myxococcota bacterium]
MLILAASAALAQTTALSIGIAPIEGDATTRIDQVVLHGCDGEREVHRLVGTVDLARGERLVSALPVDAICRVGLAWSAPIDGVQPRRTLTTLVDGEGRSGLRRAERRRPGLELVVRATAIGAEDAAPRADADERSASVVAQR